MVAKWLVKLCLIITVILVVSACGNSRQGKIAVVSWQLLEASHPMYGKLEQGEKILKDLQMRRLDQERLARAQLGSVEQLRSLRRLSQESYLNADYNTHLAERRAIESERLRQFIAEAEAEAEAELAPRTKAAEDEYQLRLFNLRARLESVRMKPDERSIVEAEIQQLQRERGEKVAQLQKEKQAYVDAKVGPYVSQMRERVNQYANEYKQNQQNQVLNSDERDQDLLEQAPKALADALSIMDREIAKQEDKNLSLRQQITRDIEECVAKQAELHGYNVVFKSFKVNLQAEDITEAVAKDLKINNNKRK